MLLQLPSSFRVTSLLPTTPAGASTGAELVTSDGRSLALTSARLFGEARGGLARLVLEQRFENSYDDNLRVTYRMPLPADGAVSGYEFVIGGRTIKGAIDRKAKARDRFESAVASGHTAALLEQERADIFTQQIGNIPAREAVVARITIDQRLVWLPEGEWELRFPTVIGPRYIGAADSAADVRATHIKVAHEPLRIGIQIAVAVKDTIVAGGMPTSPSHRVERAPDGTIALTAASRLDRDIVLRWPVATPAVGLSLATARPGKTIRAVTAATSAAPRVATDDAFGLLTIVPPARDARPVAVPRDLIVLLDTSGSMDGGPLEKAKQVIGLMLESLDESDRFELIEFSSEPRRYLEEPVVATATAKQAALKWLRTRRADGATEMRDAVIEALTTLRIGAQRQIVVVTDGYVGGERQILEALNRRLPKSCRLHVLGVGSAVNRSLATSLARAGRGVEVTVGIDEDAERGAKRLLDRTRMPVLTNVEISGSALLRHAPERMPDVFEGAPLVAALALRADGGELVVRGQLAREPWMQTIKVPAVRPGEGNGAIVALYARERVADVEANAMFASVDGEIEDLGMTFQIATRMTSWIAVDETRKVTGPTRNQLVPQELPYGTSAGAFGLRAPSAMQTRAGHVPVAEAMMSASVMSLDLGSVDNADSDFAEAAPGESALSAEIAPGGAPRGYDDSSDVARSVTRRSVALSSSAPPPRVASDDAYDKDDDDDDDFREEAPTGEVGPRSLKTSAPRAKTMMSLRTGGVTAPRSTEPVPTSAASPASAASSSPSAQQPVDMSVSMRWRASGSSTTSRLSMMLTILGVLALIALLLWWLLG